MRTTRSRLKAALPLLMALWGAPMLTSGAVNAEATAPFAGLSGRWLGDGSIVLTKGTTERLRCDATYKEGGGGESVDLKLRCASDSYRFDISISLVDTAGAVLGNWRESTENVDGGISGTASRGLIQVTARGQTFAAAVTVTTRGADQSVRIRAQSGELSQVSITLHKAR
jgi:hypothetical protein